MKPRKQRLDELLVAKGLVESRARAKALILAGKVRSGTQVLDKVGKVFSEDTPLEVIEPYPFVSRGAGKLEGFLAAHPIDLEGKHILDIGASTGGFTDLLLQRGAASATCVDVGHGQLHAKLRDDPRVTNLERTNARTLAADSLPRSAYDLAVVDVSFISLKKILPAVWPFVADGGWLVCLIKPQFEAEKKEVDRGGGVIRDDAIRERIVADIRSFAQMDLPGSQEIGLVDSPLHGPDGNREVLFGLRKFHPSNTHGDERSA